MTEQDLQWLAEMKIVRRCKSFPTFSSDLLPEVRLHSGGSDPSYLMLCKGMDFNSPPVQTDEKMKSMITGVDSNLKRKSESLAVSALVERGGDLDVIASVEVIKQIFRSPYSNEEVCIAVHRVGQTLVLNPGDSTNLVKTNQWCLNDSTNVDKTNEWILNFAMKSMRMEECDCLPKKISEKTGDYEKHIRSESEFSRIVDCQFGRFRMRLGSDMVLFRNENAVSLHLLDLSQHVTPLNWLEVWLDNVMVGVPELAICYHYAGVVEGYELLKTEDMFLANGICRNSFPIEPLLVNGLAVLDFLMSKCEKDCGVYWLYKGAGEDLFKLSEIPKNRSVLGSVQKWILHRVAESSVMNASSVASQAPTPLHQTITPLISLAIQYLGQPWQEVNMWSFILHLGESYLSLGEAYYECGQLPQALTNVELACSIYGSMPHKFEETFFVSAMYSSFALQLNLKRFDELVLKLLGNKQVEDLEAEPVPSYTRFSKLSSRWLFWAKVWLLVGEIYVKFQALFSETAEGTPTNQLRMAPNQLPMPSEVEEVVERLKKKLPPALRQTCASCSLVTCSCTSKARSQKNKQQKNKQQSGGIFKFLRRSLMDDSETNFLRALDCFKETERVVSIDLPSGCEEIQSISKRKAHLWNLIGGIRINNKRFDDAEEAYAHSVSEFKSCGDMVHAAQIQCNMGIVHRKLADMHVLNFETIRLDPTKKRARKKHLNSATEEFIKCINFFKAAVMDINCADMVPDEVKYYVSGHLGDGYMKLGMLLAKENSIAYAAYGLNSVSTSSDRLTAKEAIEEALAVYKGLGEAGRALMAQAAEYQNKLS